MRRELGRSVGASILAVLIVACAPRLHRRDPCATPAVETGDWRDAHGSVFALRLPPSFQAERVQGIDSEVARWSAGEVSIDYDYGAFSDRLEAPPRDARDLEVCDGVIGGRPARVRRYRGAKGEHVVEAHWLTEKSTQDPRQYPRASSLTLYGSAPTPRDADVLLAIVHSVRFTR